MPSGGMPGGGMPGGGMPGGGAGAQGGMYSMGNPPMGYYGQPLLGLVVWSGRVRGRLALLL